MSNTTGNDRPAFQPLNTDWWLQLQWAIPAASTTYYPSQFIGRDASGNLVQGDDTSKYEFFGLLRDMVRPTVDPTDSLGDKKDKVARPLCYLALIASAAAGDEGKKVFVKFNNEVSYSPGTNANFAGHVLKVENSTHVWVAAPWFAHVTGGALKGIYTAAAAAGTTLTKFALNQLVVLPLTASEAITLPAASACSPSDEIQFINTSANSSVPTLTAAGADTINGAATYAMSATQYSQAVLKSDGVSKWYVGLPGASGTVGATTFNANSGTSSATFTVTDNVANTFAVGPNGATNPALTVDCSVGSAATGINIIGRAAGAGVTLATVTSGTDEDLLVAPAGAGGVKITSHSANSLAVGRQGSTNPSFSVDSSAATCVTGLKVTSKASGAGLAVVLTGGSGNEAMTLDTTGSGTLTLQGTATGNVIVGSGLTFSDAKNIVFNTTTGTKIGTATSQKLAFYNAAPVVQPVASTDVTGFVAGSGTASKSDSVWAGASGASAYTVGGIVTALKALGLLAA